LDELTAAAPDPDLLALMGIGGFGSSKQGGSQKKKK
jgi:hypothetical protein